VFMHAQLTTCVGSLRCLSARPRRARAKCISRNKPWSCAGKCHALHIRGAAAQKVANSRAFVQSTVTGTSRVRCPPGRQGQTTAAAARKTGSAVTAGFLMNRPTRFRRWMGRDEPPVQLRTLVDRRTLRLAKMPRTSKVRLVLRVLPNGDDHPLTIRMVCRYVAFQASLRPPSRR